MAPVSRRKSSQVCPPKGSVDGGPAARKWAAIVSSLAWWVRGWGMLLLCPP